MGYRLSVGSQLKWRTGDVVGEVDAKDFRCSTVLVLLQFWLMFRCMFCASVAQSIYMESRRQNQLNLIVKMNLTTEPDHKVNLVAKSMVAKSTWSPSRSDRKADPTRSRRGPRGS